MTIEKALLNARFLMMIKELRIKTRHDARIQNVEDFRNLREYSRYPLIGWDAKVKIDNTPS